MAGMFTYRECVLYNTESDEFLIMKLFIDPSNGRVWPGYFRVDNLIFLGAL